MLSVERYGLNSSSFEFKFTTSNGDKIDLKLSDSIEASSSFKKSSKGMVEEFTLKHQFSYEFHYEGNGLSKKDLEEIKEAFKKIKPLFEKFIKEKDANDRVIANVANHFKSFLPTSKNENHLNAMKQEGVNTFDEVLKSIKASMEKVKKAKELFDKLFSKKLEIFA
ncbi:ATP/GTP-binding protein [Caminibacter sp.]